VGREDVSDYFAMDLVEGETLAVRLSRAASEPAPQHQRPEPGMDSKGEKQSKTR